MGLGRREFLQGAGAMGLGLVAGCGQWRGQGPTSSSPDRHARIGFLSGSSPDMHIGADAFRQGMADHGYVEGRNLTIEWRYGDGLRDPMPELAAELVSLQPDVIVVPSSVDANVVRQVTRTTSIVVAGSNGDLVSAGLAASHARPGGNVTGISVPIVSLTGKRLQLLTEAMPRLSRLAVLRNTSASSTPTDDDYETFAGTLGVPLQLLDVNVPQDFERAFAAAVGAQAGALYVSGPVVFTRNRAKVIALAREHRLPTMFAFRVFVDDGGLMAYEHRVADAHRRAAYYVDRLLKGASPADLPIEEPMTFDFVINLRTAQALGLTIPQSVLLQATEVIQ